MPAKYVLTQFIPKQWGFQRLSAVRMNRDRGEVHFVVLQVDSTIVWWLHDHWECISKSQKLFCPGTTSVGAVNVAAQFWLFESEEFWYCLWEARKIASMLAVQFIGYKGNINSGTSSLFLTYFQWYQLLNILRFVSGLCGNESARG